jgi:hypothetical protein
VDKIVTAFDQACDQPNFDAAAQLAVPVEFPLRRLSPSGQPGRRVNIESLMAAHERLCALRNPDTRQDRHNAG